MSERKKCDIPAEHPLCRYFFRLTQANFEHLEIRDEEVILYVTDILLRFARTDQLYRLRTSDGEQCVYLVDMLLAAAEAPEHGRREARRQIGDYSLFLLGIFPESLRRPRRPDFRKYFLSQGKMSYSAVAEMDWYQPTASLFRRLAEKFEQCVRALNLARDYFSDPAYRYLCRQMNW